MGKGIITVEAGKGAPLRLEPDASAEMLGALEQGTQIDLLSYGDGWYLVEVDGIRGYVAGSMVQALDGIAGLGKLKINKNKIKSPGKTLATAARAAKNTKGGIFKKTAAAVKKTSPIVKAKKSENGTAQPKSQEAYKQMLTSLIKKAKTAGVTEDEIKEMASLNGIGNLTDLQGVDGLKDLVKKVGSGIKNVAQKVVGTSKQITETADAVNNAKEAVNNAQAQQAQAATVQAAAPAAQVVTVNPNYNNQNQLTMEAEKKEKLKKGLIIGGVVAGVAAIGIIGYKMSKKKAAAANNDKGALNGVKKRRKKSRKSKKNTGNKMLNLK